MTLLRGLAEEQVALARQLGKGKRKAKSSTPLPIDQSGIPLGPPEPIHTIAEAQAEVKRLIEKYGSIYRAAHAFAWQHQVKLNSAYSLLLGIRNGRGHGGSSRAKQRTVQDRSFRRLKETT